MPAGRKILIIEGNSAVSFPLGGFLRKQGWAVISAADATHAIQMARRQKPDAIIVGARLPGGGGVTAFERIRSSVHTADIPAIAVAERDSAEWKQFTDAGADVVLESPAAPESIQQSLLTLVERPALTDVIPRVQRAVLDAPSRAAAVKSTGLLDSKVEASFDELTRLTSRLLNVPVALVSVVDADRQFFKSETGLSEQWRTLRQTPLTHSFCQWVVGGNEEVVISDARNHSVLRSNRAIPEMGVVAYAGVPFGAKGETVGSFCAIDSRPREWTKDDLVVLRELSRVLDSYIAWNQPIDAPLRINAVAEGVMAATRMLMRVTRERAALGRIVEEESRRLASLVA